MLAGSVPSLIPGLSMSPYRKWSRSHQAERRQRVRARALINKEFCEERVGSGEQSLSGSVLDTWAQSPFYESHAVKGEWSEMDPLHLSSPSSPPL